jgi:hypothetical protein
MLRFFCKGLSIFIIISIVIYSTVRLKQRHTIVDENGNVHQPMELKTVYRSDFSTSSLHYFHTVAPLPKFAFQQTKFVFVEDQSSLFKKSIFVFYWTKFVFVSAQFSYLYHSKFA